MHIYTNGGTPPRAAPLVPVGKFHLSSDDTPFLLSSLPVHCLSTHCECERFLSEKTWLTLSTTCCLTRPTLNIEHCQSDDGNGPSIAACCPSAYHISSGAARPKKDRKKKAKPRARARSARGKREPGLHQQPSTAPCHHQTPTEGDARTSPSRSQNVASRHL